MIIPRTVLCAIGSLVCVFAMIGTSDCTEADSVLAVFALDHALDTPEMASCPALVLSSDSILVVVPKHRLAQLAGAHRPVLLAEHPDFPLWTTPGSLPQHAALGAGVDVIYRSRRTTVFAASRANAYRLMAQGYFVVEVEPVRLEDLRPRPDGRDTVERLLGARPLTRSRVEFMKSISDSVDTLRLKRNVYSLNYDEAAGDYRSRYACREDLKRDMVPYISDLLDTYITPHGGTVWQQEFHAPKGLCTYGDSISGDSIFVNIVAEKPGIRTGARYIICAHYDAIAVRESGWRWWRDAAPGADDNGTGVASVLECARLLGDLDLDVGITFIAFSGEELGLYGSKHYVSTLGPEDSVIAVINFDMLGYVEDSPRIEMVYDWKSKWLSDQLGEIADTLDLVTEFEPLDLSGISNSDHASFWVAGIPANMLIEKMDIETGVASPYYHSLADTLGNVTIEQVADNVRVVAAMLARFAEVQQEPLSDLWLSDGSIEWSWSGRGYLPMVAGGQVTATVRALNIGGSMLEPVPYWLEIWRGGWGSGRRIFAGDVTVNALAGEYTDITRSWVTRPTEYGTLLFTFALDPIEGGAESNLSNNSCEVSLEIMPQTTVVRDLHVFPNPVTDVSGAALAFEILYPATNFNAVMKVRIFDIAGLEVGRGLLETTHIGEGLVTGRNEASLSDLLDVGSDLAPGLYTCVAELDVVGEAGLAISKSRFAVAR